MENNFENKLNELEKIVSKLEGNEISLDEAIKLFPILVEW
jgi:exodeoxyribonuclease VII small subunit